MNLGCKVGAMHINDRAARLGFLGEITAFAEEVFQDIEDGIISAAEGVEAFWDEHEALRSKAGFYVVNGITIAGGVAQVELGTVITSASGGTAIPIGGLLISHGVNNIYEGLGNIYNGPNKPSVVGPTRWFYQEIAGGVYEGNIAYGTTDLTLSAYGMFGGSGYLVQRRFLDGTQLITNRLTSKLDDWRYFLRAVLTSQLYIQ